MEEKDMDFNPHYDFAKGGKLSKKVKSIRDEFVDINNKVRGVKYDLEQASYKDDKAYNLSRWAADTAYTGTQYQNKLNKLRDDMIDKGYAKGGSVKDFEKGKWLQGKQWYISKDKYSGWVLERYKGDKLIEQYQINVVKDDDYDFIEYSPSGYGDIKIPENVQLKVIRLLEKVNPKYDFGDEYENQIRINYYSTMYAKGGKTKEMYFIETGMNTKSGEKKYTYDQGIKRIKSLLKEDKELLGSRKLSSISDDDIVEIGFNHYGFDYADNYAKGGDLDDGVYKNQFYITKAVDNDYLGTGTKKDIYLIYDFKNDKQYSINKNFGIFATEKQAKRYIDLVLLGEDSTPHKTYAKGGEIPVFVVSGYYKDDKSEFSNYLISEFDEVPKGFDDDDIFYYGMSEKELKNSSENDGNDFVITEYSRLKSYAKGGKVSKYKTGITKYGKNQYAVRVDIGDKDLIPKQLNDRFDSRSKAEAFAKRLAKRNNGTYVGEDGLFAKGGKTDGLIAYNIPQEYAYALTNADSSGLTDKDEEILNEFVDEVKDSFGNAFFMSGGDESFEPRFEPSNDVTYNQGADVVTLYIQPSKDYAKGGKIDSTINSLKKGNTIKIKYGSGSVVTLKVKRRSKVNKGKVDKITFQNLSNPSGVDWYAYERGSGKFRFAMGNSAISNVEILNKFNDGGFIQEAVKEMKEKGTTGSFTKQAKNAGMTTTAFAKKVLKNPKKFTEKTRKRAMFMKNTNPEKFEVGGEIVRAYDVNINSGVGTYARGGKAKRRKQGYNAQLDESLGMRKGAKRTKQQSDKDRRDESKAMNKAMGRRAYASVRGMDKGRRKMAKGGELSKSERDAVNKIKSIASGYIGNDFLDKNPSDRDVLRMIKLKDKKADIDNEIARLRKQYGLKRFATGGKITMAGDTDFPSELLNYGKGGVARDRKFASQEKHEKAYAPKRKKPFKRYKGRK